MTSGEGTAQVKILGIVNDNIRLRIKWDDGTVSRMWMTEKEFCNFRYGEGEE